MTKMQDLLCINMVQMYHALTSLLHGEEQLHEVEDASAAVVQLVASQSALCGGVCSTHNKEHM